MYVSFSCTQQQLEEVKEKLNKKEIVEIKGTGIDDIVELEAILWLTNIDEFEKIGSDEYLVSGYADLVSYDEDFESCDNTEFELI
jgi:hypothetical protein